MLKRLVPSRSRIRNALACRVVSVMRLVTLMLLVALLAGGGVVGSSGDVLAQSKGPVVGGKTVRGFHPLKPLFRLFGLERERPRRPALREQPPQQRLQPQRTEPVRPVIVEVPKEQDARTVLVMGDALAGELAEGLVATYAETPSVRVDKLVIKQAGLAGDGDDELADRLRAIVQGREIAVVVVLIGSLDRRDIETANGIAAFRTAAWDALYARRVDKLLRAARDRRTPMVWIGLPPPKGQAKRADFGHINDVAKASIDAANSIYTDIWDVFLDENGGFTSFGPDVAGKRRRLRSADGVGFTWPGKQKVAFFAEKEIARILGSSGAFAFDGVEDDPNFIVLTGRTTAPETDLAGGNEGNAPVVDTPQYQLIVQGVPLSGPAGRVDDFRMVP